MTFQKLVNAIKKKSENYKILVIGMDNAGKSTILGTLLGINEPISPTFGYKIHSCSYNNKNLTILDIGGQASFKDYWSNYFENTDGILFILDCSDIRDFVVYLNPILELRIPTAIFANKYDLNTTFNIEKVMCKISNPDCKVNIFKTSAFDKEGLIIGFEWLLNKMRV